MRKAKYFFVLSLLIAAMALVACNKDGELDLKGIIATDTPTPTDNNDDTPAPTATAVPTKAAEATVAPTEEASPTEEPTAVPTEEPTAVPTAEPTEEPTPEPTEEPDITPEPTSSLTPVPTKEPFVLTYDVENMETEIPEALTIGLDTVKYSEMSEDGKNTLYEVSYDKIVLPDEVAEAYPYLALAVKIQNMNNLDMVEKAVEEYDQYTSDGSTLEGAFYSMYDSYDILRADSKVLSLENENSSFTGGVRPYTGIAGFSIDVETGDILKINQVCYDLDSLGTIIAYRLAEKYDDLAGDTVDVEEIIEYINAQIASGEIKFALGYEGVTFYFPTYDLIPFNLSVSLPYDESLVVDTDEGPQLISLFAKPYRTVPDNYMQTLTFGKEIELLDIDEEKSGFSTFNVCNIASSEYPGDSDGLYILINGKEKLRLEDTFFWDGELNLISVEGKKFIMIKTVQSSEDTTTYIYQIFEDGRVGYDSGDVEVDEYSDSELTPLKTVYGEGEWDFDYTDKVVYNPMNAKITFRYDVIGTNFVIASVHFDGDELRFVPNSPFYDFTFRGPLTLKKEFKAGMIDPELMFNDDESITGEMDMEVELKPGDVIYLEKCRADQDQIFFSAENGEWGTFVMDSDSFLTINGEDAYEIFDGIILAD